MVHNALAGTLSRVDQCVPKWYSEKRCFYIYGYIYESPSQQNCYLNLSKMNFFQYFEIFPLNIYGFEISERLKVENFFEFILANSELKNKSNINYKFSHKNCNATASCI